MTRKKRGTGGADITCAHCGGGGCIFCAFSGLEEKRLQLTAETEHPVVTDLDLAAHAWAKADGRTEAKNLAKALTKFARTVNEALTDPPAPKGAA